MAEIRVTRKAVDDLSDIWNYTTDRWSEQQANTYYELLIAFCRKLADTPVLFGQGHKEFGEKMYGFMVNKHIIFYRILDDRIMEVVRILHERVDLSNKFADQKYTLKR